MQAIWNGQALAEADKAELIYIEGNWYFPPSSVQFDMLEKSPTPYTCPWKGQCQYYNVVAGDQKNQDAAFCYPEPKASAIERVHKDFSGYVSFWRGVEVRE